jgi:large subunit ribosomal protein L3
MAGHLGDVRRTVRNLRLLRIDAERNLLIIGGAVPGANGGVVMVRKSRTKS